jgi:hypothetical protein
MVRLYLKITDNNENCIVRIWENGKDHRKDRH